MKEKIKNALKIDLLKDEYSFVTWPDGKIHSQKFPYLSMRIIYGIYSITSVPTNLNNFTSVLLWAKNIAISKGIKVGLVTSKHECYYIDPSGNIIKSSQPPSGGSIINWEKLESGEIEKIERNGMTFFKEKGSNKIRFNMPLITPNAPRDSSIKNTTLKECAELLGKTLGDVILLNWCSPSEVAFFKKQYDLQEIEKTGEEYFYLLMFIATHSCQLVFIKNKDLVEIILDNLHKYITEKKFSLPKQIIEARNFENSLRDRYAQYYNLLRNKEGNVDMAFFMRQLPYNFFANTLEKDLNYVFFDKKFIERWGGYRLKLGLWTGEMIKEITNFLIKLKKKYKIEN